MNLDKDNVIGIVGGMGPQAGVALYDNILCLTQATKDQQHLSVVLMSFSKYIEDRTAFLEGRSSINPAYEVVAVIEKLILAGAKIIGIPCNTSHCPEIFDVIVKEFSKLQNHITLVHMPLEVCKYIQNNYFEPRRIGLMVTNGTYKSKIYESLLLSRGYEVVIPEFSFQNDVIHKMIYDPKIGVKANPKGITEEIRLLQHRALSFFKEYKAEVIILGCTELSLIFRQSTLYKIPVVDSTQVLAKALIREATYNKQEKMAKKVFC